jgi:membrane protease YdiL (CAAX protease family)
LKDAARLLGYFAATILFGVVAAPILFWFAQWLASHGILTSVASFDFESFFHRALLLGALLFLWPLLRSLRIRNLRDLELVPNRYWKRDMGIGFLISLLPVLCFAFVLVWTGVYSVRPNVRWPAVASVALTAVVVPFIEEALFRGLFLGVLLRANRVLLAVLLSSGIYSILHFLKAPDHTTRTVEWTSGFTSLVHSFDQFSEPMLVLAGFTTLFFIGVILAGARMRTRSLWLPIGLHAGWILANGTFNKIAHREMLALPWIGKSLLIGIVPLLVCCVSWALLEGWLRHAQKT